MPTSAALTDLIDGLESLSDSTFAFLDRETGEVIVMSDESLSLAKYEPDRIAALPDWQKEDAKIARQIETTDRYLSLPDRTDVNEWQMMRDFCDQVEPDKIRASLQNAVHGNHAFRRFKDQIATHDLWDPWNKFRASAFEELLRDWCEDNDITLVTSANQNQSRQSISS